MENEKIKQMEDIMEKSVSILENNRKDIFQIYESSRNKVIEIENKIKMINRKLKEIIDKKEAKKENTPQKSCYIEEGKQKKDTSGDQGSLSDIYKDLLKLLEGIECLEKKRRKFKKEKKESAGTFV